MSAGCTGVRPGLGLGQSEGSQRMTGEKIGQPAGFLLRRTEVSDRVDAESDGGLESNSE